jgi:hypothetical protein
MSQLKTAAMAVTWRLGRSVASTALALSACAGGLLLSGGEAKAKVCWTGTFPSPSTPPDFPCTDGDFTLDWISGPPAPTNSRPAPIVDEVNLNDNGSVPIGLPQPNDTASIQLVWEPDADYTTPSVFEYKITHDGGELFGFSRLDPAGAVYDIIKELSYDSNFSTIFATLHVDSDPLTPMPGIAEVFYPLENDFLYSRVTINSAIDLNDIDDFHQTPGPLPILGAGTAFGLSRKLRSRIKASRAA